MCDTGISLTDFEQEESQINYLLTRTKRGNKTDKILTSSGGKVSSLL